MWKRIVEVILKYVRLAEETNRNRENLKELEKDYSALVEAMARKFHELQLTNEKTTHEVQRLKDELAHQRELADSERRLLKVELENYLLRHDRGLPSLEAKQLSKSSEENEPTQ